MLNSVASLAYTMHIHCYCIKVLQLKLLVPIENNNHVSTVMQKAEIDDCAKKDVKELWMGVQPVNF